MPSSTSPVQWRLLIGLMAVVFVTLPRDLSAKEGTACHPAIDASQPQYVIGYGSLMSTGSKERTWPHTGVNLPVRVRGFERSWNARGTSIGFSTTFLGVERKDGAEIVAALYRVFDTKAFVAGDAREFFYCRAPVALSQISMLDGSSAPTRGRVWIYTLKPESSRAPDADFPIVQSYVDLFLSGCIELARRVVVEELDFLAACITTTKGWPVHWVNDRIHPRRPFRQPNAARIDTVLRRLLPKQFEAIRIE